MGTFAGLVVGNSPTLAKSLGLSGEYPARDNNTTKTRFLHVRCPQVRAIVFKQQLCILWAEMAPREQRDWKPNSEVVANLEETAQETKCCVIS